MEGGKKTGPGRAVEQLVSTKQSHERFGKRGESFVNGQQGEFARNCVADHDGGKINQVVVAKACADEAYLFLDSFEDSRMLQNLSKGCHFSEPRRGLTEPRVV